MNRNNFCLKERMFHKQITANCTILQTQWSAYNPGGNRRRQSWETITAHIAAECHLLLFLHKFLREIKTWKKTSKSLNVSVSFCAGNILLCTSNNMAKNILVEFHPLMLFPTKTINIINYHNQSILREAPSERERKICLNLALIQTPQSLYTS